jgi:hypothetical protein
MLRHFVIRAMEIRLVTARARDAGPRIIGHEQLRGALEEIEGAHMAIDPVRESLSECCSRKGVRAGAEHGDEDRSGRSFAVFAIVDRHGVACPVHERLLAGMVLLPQHHVLIPIPALVQLAEPAIAVAIPMSFTIFFPDQLQRHMLMRLKLRMDLAEVHSRPLRRRRPHRPRWKQKFVEPLFVAIVWQWPAEPDRGCSLQISMNGRLTNRATAGDLLLLQAQPESET